MKNRKVMAAVISIITVAAITVPAITQADTEIPGSDSGIVTALRGSSEANVDISFNAENVKVYLKSEEGNVLLESGAKVRTGDTLYLEGIEGKTLTGFNINGTVKESTSPMECPVLEGASMISIMALYEGEDISSEGATITFDSSNVIVTLDGTAIESGAKVPAGKTLVLSGVEGKTLTGFNINGETRTSSGPMECPIFDNTTPVSIVALYSDENVPVVAEEGTIPVMFSEDNVKVSLSSGETTTPITSGTKVNVGATIVFEGIEGKTLKGYAINNTINNVTTAGQYVVEEGVSAVSIVALYEGDPVTGTIPVTFSTDNIKVSVKGEETNTVLNSGDSVHPDDVLVIEGVGSKVLKSVVINNVEKTVDSPKSEFVVPSTWMAISLEGIYSDENVPDSATISFSADNVKVSVKGEESNTPIEPGAKVSYGSTVILEGVQIEGKRVKGYKVDDQETLTNGSATFTVVEGMTSVTVEALYEDVPVIENVTIAFSSDNVKVSIKGEENNTPINPNATVTPGTELLLEGVEGKTLKGFKVNEETIDATAAKILTVGNGEETLSIEALYEESSVTDGIPITFDETSFSVKNINSDSYIRSGDKVPAKTLLVADVKDNVAYTGIKINGKIESFKSFVMYSVKETDESVEFSLFNMTANIPVTYDSNVTVTDGNGNTLSSGIQVSTGCELTITAADNGKTLKGITVNGNTISETSPAKYTTKDGDEKIEISAIYEGEDTSDKVSVTYDSNIISVTDASGDEVANGGEVANSSVIKIVAKTTVNERLTGIKINGNVVSTTNGYEYTIPADVKAVSIEAEYSTTNYGSAQTSDISTYNSNNVEVSVNSDEFLLFYDSKPVYGDAVFNKSANGKLYFSAIEDPSRGTIKAVRYNGQRIKYRGYFFINIDELAFDHLVIELEY